MTRSDSPPASITVVAGVIRDSSGKVLLARRPAGRHMAGLWEFPGGKAHDGEAPAAALERELAEELDIEVAVGEPLTFSVHEETGLRILLLFYEAAISSGEPRPREGQEIAWVSPADLRRYPTPPADAGLVERLAAALGP
jgi:8-oxo-dGTP diphosphatase